MNAISRKQHIYLEIFGRVLPMQRNVQAGSLWYRIKSGSLYPEAELVHNLPELLLEPAFQKRDVWWLKSQGRQYRKAHVKRPRASGDVIVSFLDELEQLVPDDLRAEFNAEPSLTELSFMKH